MARDSHRGGYKATNINGKKKGGMVGKKKNNENSKKGVRNSLVNSTLNSTKSINVGKTETRSIVNQDLRKKQQQLRNNQIAKHRHIESLSLNDLTAKASQQAESFESKSKLKQEDVEAKSNQWAVSDNSRRAYMRELNKVVSQADVIIEVLDARDPMGCRTLEMEETILSKGGKKIILVLNKIDLVPKEVILPWLQYLRRSFPAVAFRASTQEQSKHLAQTSWKADKIKLSNIAAGRSVGTDALMQLLKNYCRSRQLKTAITVGIIGYPNVGKSSLINSLKRCKAASVSSQAGHTKVVQEIQLDKKIKLLDCPGVVFDDTNTGDLLLKNCLNTEALSDPIPAVETLMQRCTKQQLEKIYDIGSFDDVIDFLGHIARKKGKLGKGGIPDRKGAARFVLQDWNSGKIPTFTPPPKDVSTHLESEIVSCWGNDFDLDNLLNPSCLVLEEGADPTVNLEKMNMEQQHCSVVIPQEECPPNSRMTDVMVDSDDESEEEIVVSDEKEDDVPTHSTNVKYPKFEEDMINPQTALISRRKAKNWRKQKRRMARNLGSEVEDIFCDQIDSIAFNRESSSDDDDDDL